MQTLYSILAAFVAYLIGSISFAVVVSRAMGLADPRTFGSRNPGATNVLRTGNKAAELFADRHERWTADARREWLRLNSN